MLNITEVRVTLVDRVVNRLVAYASVTLNGSFVIRDLKILEGDKGLFIAMPSRKHTDFCPECGTKNYVQQRYCGFCGTRLSDNRTGPGERSHRDVAHPVNLEARCELESTVLTAYFAEKQRGRHGSEGVSTNGDH